MSGSGLIEELRRAISAGLFPKAQEVLAQYRRVLDSLPGATQERERALREAADITEWARRVTLAARAAAVEQLASLPATPALYRAEKPARHTWEIVG